MKREPRGRVDINWFSPDVNGEYKYTRRMYPQLKNMQSGGFSLGNDSIAKKYVERGPIKVDYKEELLKKLGEVAYSDRKSMPIIQSRAAEDTSPARISEEDLSVDRTPPKRHITQLQRTSGRQPFEEIIKTKPRIADSPLRAAGSYSLSKPSNPKTDRPYGNSAETPALPVSGPRSVSPFFRAARDISPPNLSTLPLESKNSSNQLAHELGSHPLFRGPRYTKKNPKLRMDNPITGVPPEYYNRRQDTCSC